MSFQEWTIFMGIWIAASIPLGPNALNCISSSASYGFRKGLWSVVGVFFAAVLHMSLAFAGLAAFVSTNPMTFEILRWLGVFYLAWMGLSLLRSKGELSTEKQTRTKSNFQLFVRAILISLSNPKAIFSWLAVFSQFIDSTNPLAPQLIVLAPSALLVTAVVYLTYSAIGTSARQLFAGMRKRWFDRVTGSLYLAFAIGLISIDLRKS